MDSMQPHIDVVQRQPLSQLAHEPPPSPSSFDPFVAAVSTISAAVRLHLRSRPSHARRLIAQTLPPLSRVLQQPFVLEPRFAALRSSLLPHLLFFYAHCERDEHHLVIPVVRRIAARCLSSELHTLLLSLMHIAVASKSPSFVPHCFRASPRHDRFVKVLQAVLQSSAQSDIEHNLIPSTCINVVNTLSTACYLQWLTNGHHHTAFGNALLTLFESHVASTNDNIHHPTLFFLAVCAALIRFTNIVCANVSNRRCNSVHLLRNLLIQFIHQALQAFEQRISTLAHKDQIYLYDRSHAASISTVFIISSISSIAVKHLSTIHIQLIRQAIQACMQTSLNKHRPTSAKDATFHRQVARTISNHSTTLATAYANFIQQERSFQSSVHFLTTLVSTAPSAQSVSRFIYTVIANTHFTPDIAVAYASILSLITADNPILQRAVSHRLALLIADDDDATKAVVQLICVILVNRTPSNDTNRRLAFLSRFLSLVLATRRTNTASVHTSTHVFNDEMEDLWALFVREMVSAVDSDPKSEPTISAVTECLAELVKQEDMSTKLATDYLRETLTRVLIEKYLFRDMPITMRNRLLHVVLFLDAITTTTKDNQTFEEFLTTLIESARKVGAKADRMIGILLLRCLTRCDEKVVSVALDRMTSFIGTNRHRKETFLPLVRAAVLGLDTGKKDVCVVWILRLFGDMKQQQNRSMRTPSAVETNLRAAKL